MPPPSFIVIPALGPAWPQGQLLSSHRGEGLEVPGQDVSGSPLVTSSDPASWCPAWSYPTLTFLLRERGEILWNRSESEFILVIHSAEEEKGEVRTGKATILFPALALEVIEKGYQLFLPDQGNELPSAWELISFHHETFSPVGNTNVCSTLNAADWLIWVKVHFWFLELL